MQASNVRFAVMNKDNDVVYTASGFAFYKTMMHAENKANSPGHGKWRVVKVTFEEIDDE